MSNSDDEHKDDADVLATPRFAESNKLKVGDYFSQTDYFKLDKFESPWYHCTTAKGKSIRVDSGVVNGHCFSADQYTQEKKVTRTKLVEIFMTRTGDKIFTVEFEKQLTPEVLDNNLQTTEYGKDTPHSSKRRKILKDAMHGEPRKLIGFMKRVDNGMGRSDVIDLEQPDGRNVRQVDHRTIKSLILMGTKYVVK